MRGRAQRHKTHSERVYSSQSAAAPASESGQQWLVTAASDRGSGQRQGQGQRAATADQQRLARLLRAGKQALGHRLVISKRAEQLPGLGGVPQDRVPGVGRQVVGVGDRDGRGFRVPQRESHLDNLVEARAPVGGGRGGGGAGGVESGGWGGR